MTVKVPQLHTEFFVGERVIFKADDDVVRRGVIGSIVPMDYHTSMIYNVIVDDPVIPSGDDYRHVPWRIMSVPGGYLKRDWDSILVARDKMLEQGLDSPDDLRNEYLNISGIDIEIHGFSSPVDEYFWAEAHRLEH
jgi:hypothetical protein